MSPYHVQIDSLYFHIMKGSLLKSKQISLLPLHKKHDLKNTLLLYHKAVRSPPHLFFVHIKMRGKY